MSKFGPAVTGIHWELPPWAAKRMQELVGVMLPSDDQGKMKLALELLDQHIDAKTGGPFVAFTYDIATGEVLSIGANRVVAEDNPCLHAEPVAIQLGTKRIHNFQFD